MKINQNGLVSSSFFQEEHPVDEALGCLLPASVAFAITALTVSFVIGLFT